MIHNYQKEVSNITNQIAEKYKPEKIILFGSFAYGQPKENSDVDLVVIKNTKESFVKRLFQMAKIIRSSLGAEVLVYTPEEWEKALKEDNFFVKEIAENGKVLYVR